MSKKAAQIYQLKVTLRGSKPPIWRRLLVPSDITLLKLHLVMQVAMGWEDAHLHQFIVGEECYSVPIEDFFEGIGCEDSRRVKLSKLVTGQGFKFTYEYDFGDSWDHTILVEKILPPDPSKTLPTCIKGVRACPPEDVGGIWSYVYFLEAIKDPQHPDHASYREWLSDAFDIDVFDPEAFDLETVNELLRTI